MNPSAPRRDQHVTVIGNGRAGLPALLLALLGLWSLAGIGSGGSAVGGAGATHAPGAIAAGEFGLSRSGPRPGGLQLLQPSGKSHDDDDEPQADGTAAAAGSSVLRFTHAVAAGPGRAVDPVLRRPLPGSPQNPRAPPHFA